MKNNTREELTQFIEELRLADAENKRGLQAVQKWRQQCDEVEAEIRESSTRSRRLVERANAILQDRRDLLKLHEPEAEEISARIVSFRQPVEATPSELHSLPDTLVSVSQRHP